MTRFFISLSLMALLAFPALAKTPLKTEEAKVGYLLGLQFGSTMKAQGLEVDMEALKMGLEDGHQGSKPQIDQEEAKAVMDRFRKDMMGKMQAMQQKMAAENIATGEKFLKENKSKPGVKVTKSGLQYKVLTSGKGAKPSADSKVKVHYEGRLINGQVFDSSYKRGEPASFPLNGVIAGWTEALTLMTPGSKWQLYIPAKLAYGERGMGQTIPPNSVLVFDVELLEVL
ncbi:MAG: FKBP-type peptidyl-prolyl cis-trans isomerase [bacterium]|nr:FKBP-type peptidyl-prolyl cis-trans isomerase [bacterium]